MRKCHWSMTHGTYVTPRTYGAHGTFVTNLSKYFVE
jgi:hypothetical protein